MPSHGPSEERATCGEGSIRGAWCGEKVVDSGAISAGKDARNLPTPVAGRPA